jgi:hypothetical protein
MEAGVRPGPMYAMLQQGRDVTLRDGTVVCSYLTGWSFFFSTRFPCVSWGLVLDLKPVCTHWISQEKNKNTWSFCVLLPQHEAPSVCWGALLGMNAAWFCLFFNLKENTEFLTISHRCATCNWQGSCRRRGFLCLGPLAFSPGPLIRRLHDASLLLHLYR